MRKIENIKSKDDFFFDWFQNNFRCCDYSDEESYSILAELKNFVYFYKKIGSKMFCRDYVFENIDNCFSSSFSRFAILNVLNGSENMEYGGSVFGSWLTDSGEHLFKYIDSKDVCFLVDVVRQNMDYKHYLGCDDFRCCNCDFIFPETESSKLSGCENNPFFKTYKR